MVTLAHPTVSVWGRAMFDQWKTTGLFRKHDGFIVAFKKILTTSGIFHTMQRFSLKTEHNFLTLKYAHILA